MLPNSISPYLNKYGMQSNNCGRPVYVLGDPDFKHRITWLLSHLFMPFLKMAVVNTNVPTSQTVCHLKQCYRRCCIDLWMAISICYLSHVIT